MYVCRIQKGSGDVHKARRLVHVGTHVQGHHQHAYVSVSGRLLAWTPGLTADSLLTLASDVIVIHTGNGWNIGN